MLANKVSRFFIALGLTMATFVLLYVLASLKSYTIVNSVIVVAVLTWMFYKLIEPINDNDD